MNRPDVLSDNKICELAGNKYLREGNIKNRCDELVPIKETGSVYLERCLEIAQAQRDADAAYYEPLIQQAKGGERRKIFNELPASDLIKVAQEEIAREIIEDIGFIAQSEKLTQYLKDKYLKG